MSRHSVSPYLAAACAIALLGALAWIWYTGGYTAQQALDDLRSHAHEPVAPLIVMLLFVAGGFVFVPVMALIALTGFVYAPAVAAAYALLGACASAAAAYGVGRCYGYGLVKRYAGPRVTEARRRLRSHGLAAIVLVRVVPSGPFTLLNLVAGASGIRFRDFMLGTVIGMAPGIAITVGLVHGLRAAWRAPGAGALAWIAGAIAAAIALAVLAHRAARRRSREKALPPT